MTPNELRNKADSLPGLDTDAVMLLYEAAEYIEALQAGQERTTTRNQGVHTDMQRRDGEGKDKVTFEKLNQLVKDWAAERGILDNSTAQAQLEKLEEERQETIDALRDCNTPKRAAHGAYVHDVRKGVIDGFGDMLVCMINAAAIAGVDPVDALEHAYNEIKDRTGYLNSDGVFVKDKQA